MRFDYKLLKSYTEEHNITLLKDYYEQKLTRETIIEGKCIDCDENTSKNFRLIIENSGFYCTKCTKLNTKIKIKDTCLERYGFNCPSQSEEIKQKMKDTCLERYGVENASQSEEIKQKMKDTCLERYGVENASQSVEIKQKKINTCLKNYGVEYPSQSEENKYLFTKLWS